MVKFWNEEVVQGLLKWIVPALVGITASLATKMKNKKVSFFSAITTIIIGLCMAYALSEPIYETLGETWAGTTLAGIGMFGDRISHWFLFVFKFKSLGDTIEGKVKKWIENW